jgi:hypothetical protein
MAKEITARHLNLMSSNGGSLKCRVLQNYSPASCNSSRDGGNLPRQINKWLPIAFLNAVRCQFPQLFFNSLHGKGAVNNLQKQQSKGDIQIYLKNG